MPELPEVNKVAYVLNERVKGRQIKDIEVYYPKIISDEYKPLISQHINRVFRIGKYIIFELDYHYLISHMRMEGRYYLGNDLSLKHNHLNIILDDIVIYYQDFRKFGRFNIIGKEANLLEFLKIKKDALEVDEEYLRNHLKVNKAIKTVLLDQKILAGIGNIYADEICFEAKINPMIIANKIKDYGKLEKAIKDVLNRFIKIGLDSISDDSHISWEFDLDTNVHFKKNCKVCGSEIKKIKLNQRSTYYCERCQGTL